VKRSQKGTKEEDKATGDWGWLTRYSQQPPARGQRRPFMAGTSQSSSRRWSSPPLSRTVFVARLDSYL